jgi:hypothetical protein
MNEIENEETQMSKTKKKADKYAKNPDKYKL